MGVRSWMERGCRPRDGAPKYVELWSTGYSSSDSEGKPTACSGRKAAVLDATRRVFRIPPGSESGACIQKGDSGTWESQWFPLSLSRLSCKCIQGLANRELGHKRWRLRYLLASEARQA